jgi:hypothetical protein
MSARPSAASQRSDGGGLQRLAIRVDAPALAEHLGDPQAARNTRNHALRSRPREHGSHVHGTRALALPAGLGRSVRLARRSRRVDSPAPRTSRTAGPKAAPDELAPKADGGQAACVAFGARLELRETIALRSANHLRLTDRRRPSARTLAPTDPDPSACRTGSALPVDSRLPEKRDCPGPGCCFFPRAPPDALRPATPPG